MKRACHCWLGLVACAGLYGAALTVQGADKKELDQAFSQLGSYTWSDSRQPLGMIEVAISDSATNARVREDLESRLLAVLKSGAQFPAKQFACRQLSVIGSARSIPVLEPLLTDTALSHMARFALERIPERGAVETLRKALSQAEGELQVGIIHSLGQLRDAGSVAALTALVSSPKTEVARAAIAALGQIATLDSLRALEGMGAAASLPLKAEITDARLVAADRLGRAGDETAAAKVFRELYSPAQPPVVRAASLRGLAWLQPTGAIDLLSKALSGTDAHDRSVAAQILAETAGKPLPVDRFIKEFSQYPAAGQLALLEVFSARGEAGARQPVLEAMNSVEPRVRFAAIRCLGKVGTAVDIPLLAGLLAKPGEEKRSAVAALTSLSGERINAGVASAMQSTSPEIRVELLEVLVARNANESAELVAQCLPDSHLSVRLTALRALTVLASERQLPALITALQAAKTDEETTAVEQAITAVCMRSRGGGTEVILAGIPGTKGAKRIALLRALGAVGGTMALEAVRAEAGEGDPEVREAAFRVLAEWSGIEAAPDLALLARQSEDPKRRTLAFRGLVRLCQEADIPPAEKVRMLGETLALARDTAEKRLVIGALGTQPHPEALRLIEPGFQDTTVLEETCLAAVKIATALDSGSDQVLPSLRRVLKTSVRNDLREQAQRQINRHEASGKRASNSQ